MYEIGTLKLTWINPQDYSILESKMFNKNALKEALEYAKNKPDWMLFELKRTQDNEYQWKLLPFGEAKRFITSMKWQNSWLMPFVSIAILGFAGYGIYKTIKK